MASRCKKLLQTTATKKLSTIRREESQSHTEFMARLSLDEKKILLDEKKKRMDKDDNREKMIFNLISIIVGSITLYFTVVGSHDTMLVPYFKYAFGVSVKVPTWCYGFLHTGDRLAKAMVLSNSSVSDKEFFLRHVEDMSKAISTGAAQGLNHTIVVLESSK